MKSIAQMSMQELNVIRQWSEREGCLDKFEIYRQRVKP